MPRAVTVATVSGNWEFEKEAEAGPLVRDHANVNGSPSRSLAVADKAIELVGNATVAF